MLNCCITGRQLLEVLPLSWVVFNFNFFVYSRHEVHSMNTKPVFTV